MNITILLLLAYTVLVIAIGIYAGWNSSNEEYLIAGRDLGSIGVMTSIVASYIGGSALVAFTAYVYEYGVSMLSVFFGVAGGYIVFIWYAYQLRQRSEEDGFLTVSDLFYDGFDRKTGLISAVMIFFAFLGFLLNQFIAGSSILSDITGWSYSTGLFISAAVITLYLVLGGFNSVIKTDVFQYVILFLLLLLIGYTMSSGNTP